MLRQRKFSSDAFLQQYFMPDYSLAESLLVSMPENMQVQAQLTKNPAYFLLVDRSLNQLTNESLNSNELEILFRDANKKIIIKLNNKLSPSKSIYSILMARFIELRDNSSEFLNLLQAVLDEKHWLSELYTENLISIAQKVSTGAELSTLLEHAWETYRFKLATPCRPAETLPLSTLLKRRHAYFLYRSQSSSSNEEYLTRTALAEQTAHVLARNRWLNYYQFNSLHLSAAKMNSLNELNTLLNTAREYLCHYINKENSTLSNKFNALFADIATSIINLETLFFFVTELTPINCALLFNQLGIAIKPSESNPNTFKCAYTSTSKLADLILDWREFVLGLSKLSKLKLRFFYAALDNALFDKKINNVVDFLQFINILDFEQALQFMTICAAKLRVLLPRGDNILFLLNNLLPFLKCQLIILIEESLWNRLDNLQQLIFVLEYTPARLQFDILQTFGNKLLESEFVQSEDDAGNLLTAIKDDENFGNKQQIHEHLARLKNRKRLPHYVNSPNEFLRFLSNNSWQDNYYYIINLKKTLYFVPDMARANFVAQCLPIKYRNIFLEKYSELLKQQKSYFFRESLLPSLQKRNTPIEHSDSELAFTKNINPLRD